MREIKFRAWDKEHGFMISPSGLEMYDEYISPIGEVIEIEGYSNYGGGGFNRNNMSSKRILMQYTGLKDNKGKEIYEGDIVKNSGYHELCIVEYHHSQYIGRYRPQTPQYKHLDQNIRDKDLCYIGLGFYVCDRKAIEVIGNVYENADLLTLREASPESNESARAEGGT